MIILCVLGVHSCSHVGPAQISGSLLAKRRDANFFFRLPGLFEFSRLRSAPLSLPSGETLSVQLFPSGEVYTDLQVVGSHVT